MTAVGAQPSTAPQLRTPTPHPIIDVGQGWPVGALDVPCRSTGAFGAKHRFARDHLNAARTTDVNQVTARVCGTVKARCVDRLEIYAASVAVKWVSSPRNLARQPAGANVGYRYGSSCALSNCSRARISTPST
jgi:hypothetical protein